MVTDSQMLSSVFFRAFLIVTCISANTSHIAQGYFGRAFFTGFLISLLWWVNARSASKCSHPFASIVYAIGAAVGTVTGMMIASY
jgi:hypothetical protein